jgi:hypothetical protein
MKLSREAIKRIPGFLLIARSVARLSRAEEIMMGSSEKKRAREQNAAMRRDRAAQKRIDKATGVSYESQEPDRDTMPEPIADEALPAERAA